jgi:hypothetical protein
MVNKSNLQIQTPSIVTGTNDNIFIYIERGLCDIFTTALKCILIHHVHREDKLTLTVICCIRCSSYQFLN